MIFKNELLKDLNDRGFIHSVTATDELEKALENPCVIYCGFDCTAPSLHIGSLIPLKMLQHFMKAGHKVIPLIGTATTKIGDPSGRDTSRPILDENEIKNNAIGIEASIASVLGDIHCSLSSDDVTLLQNGIFFDFLNVVDFMRKVGKHISINTMLRLESVRNRIENEEGMSFLEFAYSLFQAHDFECIVNMFPNRHVIQIGGSDQWGNITMGLELARKTWPSTIPIKEPFGITTPLLTASNGQKMGKTTGGAIWLNHDMLSNFDFWQFWRNLPDEDVERFMKLFSDKKLINIESDTRPINDIKKDLASIVTALARGKSAAIDAQSIAVNVFENKTNQELPKHIVNRSCINESLAIFLRDNDFMKSASEVKRMINQGGIRVNDKKIANDETLVLEEWGNFKLSIGQKKHFRIIVQ